MAIGVLIKRLAREGTEAKIFLPQIVEIRALAMRQPGYLSGETFFNLDRPEECIVISKWTTLEHWEEWKKDPRRLELVKKIEKQQGAATEYNIYDIALW